MNKKLMGIVGVLLLVGMGFYAYMYYGNNEKSTDSIKQEVVEEKKSNEKEDEDAQEATNLVVVGSYEGSGTATRQIKDGEFIHTVTGELDAPAAGKFYEGWLVNMSLSPKFFSTGKMVLQEDGTYFLEYTNPEDQNVYSEVVITEETEANGLDGVPEAHVLEGKF